MMIATAMLAVALAPVGDVDSIFREGLLALQKGELTVARDRLTEASRLRPGSGIIWAALAQVRRRLQQTAEADEAAARALAVEGENPIVLRSLVLYWSGRGQPQPFIEVANRLLKTGDTGELRYQIGKAYLASGDPGRGLEQLRAAVEKEPQNEGYIFDLGQALLQAEKFDDAAEVFAAGSKRLPGSAQLQLALGVARYGQRRFAESIEAFLRTIQLQPEAEQPYVFLGRMLEHSGDRLGEVTLRLRTFREAHPDSASANLLYARALIATPGTDAAESDALLRRSIRLDAQNWESHYELGVSLAKRRKFAEAATELEEAVQLRPAEPAPHYHLARVYDRLARPSNAVEQREIHRRLTEGTGK